MTAAALLYVIVSFGVMWELARWSDRGFLTSVGLSLSWPYQLGRAIGRILNAEPHA
jgi:hypothetical protein